MSYQRGDWRAGIGRNWSYVCLLLLGLIWQAAGSSSLPLQSTRTEFVQDLTGLGLLRILWKDKDDLIHIFALFSIIRLRLCVCRA